MRTVKKKNNGPKDNKSFMGKNLVAGGLMVLVTLGAFAQHQKRGFKKSDMTPEQVAELQTKKMTLDLELTDVQQKKVYNLNKEHAIERQAKRKEMMAFREKGEKPSDENSFDRKNARLDKALARQNEMKKILNDKQFETWKKSRKHNAHKMKKMRKHKKMRQYAKGKKRQGKRGQGPKE